jgi:hypothetical protein
MAVGQGHLSFAIIPSFWCLYIVRIVQYNKKNKFRFSDRLLLWEKLSAQLTDVGINGVFAPHPSKIRDFCHLLPREKALDCTSIQLLDKLGFMLLINLSVLQVAGADHRGFGIHRFPGDRLLFFPFFFFHIHPSGNILFRKKHFMFYK